MCELINLSPFGKLDRSRVLSLMEPVLLLGQDLLCLGALRCVCWWDTKSSSKVSSAGQAVRIRKGALGDDVNCVILLFPHPSLWLSVE